MISQRYYKVSPSVWLEPWDDDTKYVAFYVLTCPHRTTEGLFRLPLRYAQADLRWPEKRFDRAFRALIACGFIEYDDDAQVCLIVKALKWQAPAVQNHIKAAVRQLEQLPPTPLLDRLHGIACERCPLLANVMADAIGHRMTHAIAHGMPNGRATS